MRLSGMLRLHNAYLHAIRLILAVSFFFNVSALSNGLYLVNTEGDTPQKLIIEK